MQTLALLADTSDPSVLNPLAEAFKTHYDEVGFSDTKVFSGIDSMLANLIQRGCHLYLATNKRMTPTQRIMAHLGWTQYFKAIYTLDSFEPPLNSKSELLGFMICERRLALSDTVYVGDRNDDREAALANSIDFLLVGWGYGGN
jgi:phosphoglycolate phosphatase